MVLEHEHLHGLKMSTREGSRPEAKGMIFSFIDLPVIDLIDRAARRPLH